VAGEIPHVDSCVFMSVIYRFIQAVITGLAQVLENLKFENFDSRPGKSWNFCRGP